MELELTDEAKVAQEALSKKHNVERQYLTYIGIMEDHSTDEPIKLFLFNIMDEDHTNYKSTVSHRL